MVVKNFKNTEVDKKDFPSFYSILPSNVRYSKTIKPWEKIIYTEITALSNKYGFCYATNEYFSKVFGIHPQTASKYISNLDKKGFVTVVLENGYERKIYIEGGVNQMIKEGKSLGSTPPKSNGLHNNTSNNTKDIDTNKDLLSKSDEIRTVNDSLGKNPHTRLLELYSMIWETNYGFPSGQALRGANGKHFKELLEIYSEVEVGAMVVLHFEWRGANGSNDFIYQNLEDSCFPISWLPKNADSYMAYLRNRVKLDSQKDFDQFVDKVVQRCLTK